jgi:hypothetical protein
MPQTAVCLQGLDELYAASMAAAIRHTEMATNTAAAAATATVCESNAQQSLHSSKHDEEATVSTAGGAAILADIALGTLYCPIYK